MTTDSDDGFLDATTVARAAVGADATEVTFTLWVLEGPNQGQRFTVEPLEPSPVLLGKGPACGARLDDLEVSRRHAALEVRKNRLSITDLESTNGTFVDGVQIREAFLRGGETIRLGATTLRVEARTQARHEQPHETRFGRLYGQSSAMRRLYPLCRRLAHSTVPVLVEGETGTGKEQLAESLHQEGPRANEPFVVFDCTAVAPSLVESELFGHERGAFTGSIASHRGIFERAHGGTLFIDEIGDMPFELQSKLLRVIERGEVTRVGGERSFRVDARLIFATRRDLDAEVQKGRFREDLFHRMVIARVELPPLRRREGDVPLLAALFCQDFGVEPSALPAELLRRWADYNWPGNVRELKNSVLRYVAVGDLGETSELLPEPAAARPAGEEKPRPDVVSRILSLDLPLIEARAKMVEEFERRYIEYVLEAFGGNVTRAAAAAGVARRHFHRLKARYGGSTE